jgi:predicted DCC family thiol-disulfide oxidoreductase YuxK
MTETIFYDGGCGLCHWSVRFVLARDRGGAFRFAPLDSAALRSTAPEEVRKALQGTFVVRTFDGRLLTRSAAALHVGRRLGGVWRLLAGVGALIPAAVLDRGYDTIARNRHRLFRTPQGVCPVVPPALRARFDV